MTRDAERRLRDHSPLASAANVGNWRFQRGSIKEAPIKAMLEAVIGTVMKF